jgi:hypothetical protein
VGDFDAQGFRIRRNTKGLAKPIRQTSKKQGKKQLAHLSNTILHEKDFVSQQEAAK